MKSHRMSSFLGWSSALCLGAATLQAQETGKLEQMEKAFQQMQRVVEEQQKQIQQLTRELQDIKAGAATNGLMAPPLAAAPPNGASLSVTNAASAEEVDELRKRVDNLSDKAKQVARNIFNPAIGFVGEAVFSYNSKGNDATGFERPGGWDAYLRSAELNLEMSVDPFVRGYGVINATADAATGEASLGIEEAALVTRSLPWNLTAQAGRFFGEFGRLSYKHEHDLPFVLRPLALEGFVFGESQTDGVQANWLFPTEHYISLTVGTGLKFGDLQSDPGAFRSTGDMNYWGRLSTSFDLSPNVSLDFGTSGLLAPQQDLDLNDDGQINQRERQLAGIDMMLRYHPLGDTLNRGLEWGTEYLFARGDYDFNPDGTPETGDEFSQSNDSHGLYTYIAWKFNRRWDLGFLFDWAQSVEDHNAETFRYSPYVTFRPSPFQLLRLQYSYTDPSPDTGHQASHGMYLQWSYILGAHSHGFRQQR